MSSLVQAEDFYGNYPPQRVIGSECEYDIQLLTRSARTSQTGLYQPLLSDYMQPSAMRQVGFQTMTTNEDRPTAEHWLSNGALIYKDLGFFEYSTQEALGPRAAAAADAAGIIAVAKIVSASGHDEYHQGVFRRTGSAYPNQATSGYHQNFLVPADLPTRGDGQAMRVLATDVATRAWAWNGTVGQHGYEWSQKFRGIGKSFTTSLDDRASHGNKPLIMFRSLSNGDADVNPMAEWGRIELRGIDAPLSRTSMYLGFAATSLTLRLAEHWPIVKDKLQGVELRDPVRDMYRIATSRSLETLVQTVDGQMVTAGNIQEQLALAQIYLSGKVRLPADEVAATSLRLTAADYQQRTETSDSLEVLSTISDTARKLLVLRKHLPTDAVTSQDAKARGIDWFYDRIDTSAKGVGYGLRLASTVQAYANIDEKHVPQATVDQAFHKPDDTTRSSQRADFVNSQNPDVHKMYWSRAQDESGRRIVEWSDPYAGYEAA